MTSRLGRAAAWVFIILFAVASPAVSYSAPAKFPPKVIIKDTEFQVEELLRGQGILWGMEFLPSGEILLTEKSGKILIFHPKDKSVKFVAGVPEVSVHGQGGLMDVRLDPDFRRNSKLYLSYVVKAGKGFTTRIASAQYKRGQISNLKILFTAEPSYKDGQHFGSRIAIKDGHIFFTVGDRGHRQDAQKLTTHNGKLHRLKRDGAVPQDNPFVGVPNARAEIWSYGHRNPQGLQVHPNSGDLWLQEHGPRGGDEINLIKKGLNYGWPLATYGREYYGPKIGNTPPVEGMEDPKKHFTPSIAPCGLAIIPEGKMGPLSGAFLSGSLVLTHLNVLLHVDGGFKDEIRLFGEVGERIRNVAYSNSQPNGDGAVFLTTDSGRLVKITNVRTSD